MKKKWRIHIKTLGFVVVLCFLSILLGGTTLIHPRWWQILLFFLFQSLFTNAWLQYRSEKKQQHIKNYLIASVFRFATALLFASFMIFTEVPGKPRFITNFVVFYLLFVVFEVYIALIILQANSEKVNNGSKAL